MIRDFAFRAARAVLPQQVRRRLRDEVLESMAGRVTFFGDGLITTCNADALSEPAFVDAYAAGKATGSWGPFDPKWRTLTAVWAAQHASRLDGDFVECGVNKGGMSLAIAKYLHFEKLTSKTFYLFDTFNGLVADQISEKEAETAKTYGGSYYTECYDEVRKTFSPYPNVALVRGVIPDTLTQVKIDKVAYLSIDMNCAAPELMAAEFFWERMVTGAVMLLDDYGFVGHDEQHNQFNEFARKRGVKVLPLPTGQGLILKS